MIHLWIAPSCDPQINRNQLRARHRESVDFNNIWTSNERILILRTKKYQAANYIDGNIFLFRKKHLIPTFFVLIFQQILNFRQHTLQNWLFRGTIDRRDFNVGKLREFRESLIIDHHGIPLRPSPARAWNKKSGFNVCLRIFGPDNRRILSRTSSEKEQRKSIR